MSADRGIRNGLIIAAPVWAAVALIAWVVAR